MPYLYFRGQRELSTGLQLQTKGSKLHSHQSLLPDA